MPPALPVPIAALGASITAERGGNNWTEQLAKFRSAAVTFGPVTSTVPPDEFTLGGPKYKYIHFHAVAPLSAGVPVEEFDHLITSAEFAALTEDVKSGAVQVVFLENGLSLAVKYPAIYHGDLIGRKLTSFLTNTTEQIALAIRNLKLAANQSPTKTIFIILGNYASIDVTPFIDRDAQYSDPVRRRSFNDAVQHANTGLASIAARDKVPLVDLHAWAELGRPSSPPVYVAGVELGRDHYFPTTNQNPSSFPSDFFVDPQHPGPLAHALLANVIMFTLTNSIGSPLLGSTALPPLTDQEIVANWLPAKTSGFDPTQFVTLPK